MDEQISSIRPAMDTLREIRGGRMLDELAVKLHDAVSAVEALGKKGIVSLHITIAPFGTKGVAGALAVTAEIDSKLPKPESETTLLFIDGDGNLTPQQTRQREMELSIAPNSQQRTA